nr:HAMP domain-containing sensor histidine kinase [Chitinophaga nivalis]
MIFTTHLPGKDSLTALPPNARNIPEKQVRAFLANVDSLRSTIKIPQIADQYRKVLEKEKIYAAFQIRMLPLPPIQPATPPFLPADDPATNMVRIGFTNPVGYQVIFANTTWYLLQRISLSILISVLLLGVTILSFLLLYRNLKQQRKLTQLKNDFISNMTHELKTPIATVSVAIEALRSFDALEDPERTSEYLEISANEMQRLGLLVDKVLKLSMFENQEITLNREMFDLAHLTRQVMLSMKLQFEKKQAVTLLETNGENFMLSADKLHISSVLYNLLDNALKYSGNAPRLQVQLLQQDPYLEIRITDNGIGIPGEYQHRIFEKFFRIPSGNKHNTKGYGLGLSYVSHIVAQHMGGITVESEPGKGSTFFVRLPGLAQADLPDYQEDYTGQLKTGTI